MKVGDLVKFSTAVYEGFSEEERENYFGPQVPGFVVEKCEPHDVLWSTRPTIKVLWPSECKALWHHHKELEIINE